MAQDQERRKDTSEARRRCCPFPRGSRGGREQGGILTERGVHCLFLRLTVCVTDAPRLSSAGKHQRWWFVEMPKTTYNYVDLTGDLLHHMNYEF